MYPDSCSTIQYECDALLPYSFIRCRQDFVRKKTSHVYWGSEAWMHAHHRRSLAGLRAALRSYMSSVNPNHPFIAIQLRMDVPYDPVPLPIQADRLRSGKDRNRCPRIGQQTVFRRPSNSVILVDSISLPFLSRNFRWRRSGFVLLWLNRLANIYKGQSVIDSWLALSTRPTRQHASFAPFPSSKSHRCRLSSHQCL